MWRTCLLFMTMAVLFPVNGFSHCEVPCGIYDDHMRIAIISEHIATVEKSMKMIKKIEQTAPVNYNQLVRWVTNKDDYAGRIQEVITQYFMTQRIKPDMKAYTENLVLLHKMLVSAMKCKQTVDLSNISNLRSLLKTFDALYHK